MHRRRFLGSFRRLVESSFLAPARAFAQCSLSVCFSAAALPRTSTPLGLVEPTRSTLCSNSSIPLAQNTTIFILPSRSRSMTALVPRSLNRSARASGRSTSERFLLSRCDASRIRCERCVRWRASAGAGGVGVSSLGEAGGGRKGRRRRERERERTGLVEQLLDPVRRPDCEPDVRLLHVLDVLRQLEVLRACAPSEQSSRPGAPHEGERERARARTFAKSLATSIRPSLVLVLNDLTSLRAREVRQGGARGEARGREGHAPAQVGDSERGASDDDDARRARRLGHLGERVARRRERCERA